ncbi:MAG: hypothetical protein OHK0029_23690 [Armatimonadaceae bacterium]
MSITLNPEVETRLHLAAEYEGKSTEIYLNDLLDRLLPPLNESNVSQQQTIPRTLADVLAGRIGGVHGGGAAWSEDTGKAFSEAMQKKYGIQEDNAE